MLTPQLYDAGLKFAIKTMKGNLFLGEEALHNALANCNKADNWYKPFVMQCIYNECRDIYNRGYTGKVQEGRYDSKKTDIVDDFGGEILSSNEISAERSMIIQSSIDKVYGFISPVQKKALSAFMNSDSLLEAAEMAGMNYNTLKSHMKSIMAIFKYYGETGSLPENTSIYNMKYKGYNRYQKKGKKNEKLSQ